jgi:hypothetical protein
MERDAPRLIEELGEYTGPGIRAGAEVRELNCLVQVLQLPVKPVKPPPRHFSDVHLVGEMLAAIRVHSCHAIFP